MANPTAAFLIIGNEVLSGRTREGNLQVLATKLAPQGIEVRESRVVPDVESEIVAAVQALSAKYTYVFTSGGIGPTHDDITAACVAKAFGTELYEDPEARAMLLDHYGEADLTDARLKMAQVPKGARLIENPVSKAPGFWIENVLVMAGVPKIFAALVDSALPFLSGGSPVASATVVVPVGESLLADVMAQVEAGFPDLTVGSYPYFRAGNVGTSVVLRSADQTALAQAVDALKAALNAEGHAYEDQGIQIPEELS